MVDLTNVDLQCTRVLWKVVRIGFMAVGGETYPLLVMENVGSVKKCIQIS